MASIVARDDISISMGEAVSLEFSFGLLRRRGSGRHCCWSDMVRLVSCRLCLELET